MDKILPPKWLQWQPQLEQTHVTDKKLLITAGGSYTASTEWFEGPASWPGYLKDFAGFELVMDMSCVSVGNMFIHDSVRWALDNLPPGYTKDDCLVVVMWTALHYFEQTQKPEDTRKPDYSIANRKYVRWDDNYLSGVDLAMWVKQGAYHIQSLAEYLQQENVAHSFAYYANLLWNYRLPVMDTTCRFDNYLDEQHLSELRALPWLCTGDDSLYEYAWLNDYMELEDSDGYHPPLECNFDWSKNVLVPGLVRQGLLTSK